MNREEWEAVLARHTGPDGINAKIYCKSNQPIPFYPCDQSPQYQAACQARSQLNYHPGSDNCFEFEDPVEGADVSQQRHLVSDSSFFLHMGGVIAHVKVSDAVPSLATQ